METLNSMEFTRTVFRFQSHLAYPCYHLSMNAPTVNPPTRIQPKNRHSNSVRFARLFWWVRWISVVGVLASVVVFVIASTVEMKGRPGDHHEFMLDRGRICYEYDKSVLVNTFYIQPMGGFHTEWMVDFHKYPTSWFIRIPLWIPFVLFVGMGAYPWIRHWRYLRRPGYCTGCGYPLHGLATTASDSQCTCPECGLGQPSS